MALERLDAHRTTAKQRAFDADFRRGAERYDVWEEVEIGKSFEAAERFEITEEDVLAYNRGVQETDPLFVDPDHARAHSPTGELLQHPLFVVQMTFYCIGRGPGSWIRSPGARNPGQLIEYHEAFRIGEVIALELTALDKWIRRDKHYLTYQLDYYNQDDRLKATWWLTLILPPTREELARFAAD